MVKKRIINNINECIPSANTYKNIETKLDFNGFQTGNIPKTKKPLFCRGELLHGTTLLHNSL